MSSGRYSESLLQWIWKNLQFDCRNLKLKSGEALQISDPGKLNHGAGPDFLNATIWMGSVRFHGSVEIHMNEEEWFEHGHHRDANFNSVMLHVVLSSGGRTAVMQDENTIPTLVLDKYLNRSLHKLLRVKQSGALPCAGQVQFIHQKAFERQVEKVHREYFEYKVNELLECYPAEMVPSMAWKSALIRKIYSVLGIPNNREVMEQLFLKVYSSVNKAENFEEAEGIINQAAFPDNEKSSLSWKQSGMRPASRPDRRIRQAAALHFAILYKPFKTFMTDGVSSWEELIAGLSSDKLPGKSRLDILYATVFLPAIYLLGDLFHSENLKDQSYRVWRDGTLALPNEVVRPFKKSGFQITQGVKKVGLAHQYKRYCKEGNCHRCEVFKSAINP